MEHAYHAYQINWLVYSSGLIQWHRTWGKGVSTLHGFVTSGVWDAVQRRVGFAWHCVIRVFKQASPGDD